jgi:adenosylcobinamide-phosphate synthase
MWPTLSPAFTASLAVLLALAVDRLFGEPSARWHPVVWMGAYLNWAGRRIAPVAGQKTAPARWVFWRGAVAWMIGSALVLMPALALVWVMRGWEWWWQVLALGLLLKPLLSWRMLRDEVAAVEVALGVSLPAGRERLARLVSRDVAPLDETQVRESAIETLAENLNDSVVAPLFWFALAGLPGAVLYRFANTADAMWGYLGERGGRDWTWAGKWTARADDVLSWVPARLTALLLGLVSRSAAGSLRGRRHRSETCENRGSRGDADKPRVAPWAQEVAPCETGFSRVAADVPSAAQAPRSGLPAQARQTASPNSGWPMAAMALALDVRLGKPGVYQLNPAGRHPQPADTAHALRLAARAVGALAALAGTVALIALAGRGGQA